MPNMSSYDFYRAQRDDRPYCMYLRASRADLSALPGSRDEQVEEVLLRHERELLDLAARMGITIAPSAIYREIKSAENISGRPVMQQLLEEVEQGRWAGVFCKEVERLARGDGIDQALVVQAFKFSNTLIITPQKTYDPTDDADEDYFELSLVFSRREYKTTTRRLMSGRNRSATEGHYLGTKDPYGYVRYNSKETGPTLRLKEDEAVNARWMKDMYLAGTGADTIAELLNAKGLRTNTGLYWDGKRVRYLLRNPLYAGFVTWNKLVKQVTIVNGKKVNKRVKNDKPIIVPGLHPAMWSKEEHDRISNIMSNRVPKARVRQAYAMANPLSGLCFCSICGKMMLREAHNARTVSLECKSRDCPTVGTTLSVVVDAVMEGVQAWLRDDIIEDEAAAVTEDRAITEQAIDRTTKSIATAEKQLTRAYEFMEQGLYTSEEFISRRTSLQSQLSDLNAQLEELRAALDKPKPDMAALRPRIQHVMDVWPYATTAQQKNELLKTVVKRIEYAKTNRCTRADPPGKYLELTIFPLWVSSDER